MASARELQEQYYQETARSYDKVHSSEVEHQIALAYIVPFLNLLDVSTILDVGCGTGRGLKYFQEKCPRATLCGIDPGSVLLEQAADRGCNDILVCGSGESLPFADDSFDAVCEFAILHHVDNPNAVVREMIRVARKAVFISDANRFGQGGRVARMLKLALYKLRLWDAVNFIKTAGKGYSFSEGDGLFYSFSVFDSYQTLAEWADRIVLVPTAAANSASWFSPLLTSAHVLLCAFKEDQ